MQIKISEIKINPGRRDTQQRNVEELARSIAAVGLMNPITVTQDNTLIAGLHRLEAVPLLPATKKTHARASASQHNIQAELLLQSFFWFTNVSLHVYTCLCFSKEGEAG